jgi:hypothetical protein
MFSRDGRVHGIDLRHLDESDAAGDDYPRHSDRRPHMALEEFRRSAGRGRRVRGRLGSVKRTVGKI